MKNFELKYIEKKYSRFVKDEIYRPKKSQILISVQTLNNFLLHDFSCAVQRNHVIYVSSINIFFLMNT